MTPLHNKTNIIKISSNVPNSYPDSIVPKNNPVLNVETNDNKLTLSNLLHIIP